MKHKISELKGAQLDYCAAKANGRPVRRLERLEHGVPEPDWEVLDPFGRWVPWQPSELWADGGPIIEREQLTIISSELQIGEEAWRAHYPSGGEMSFGPTPLIAAMRAYVASKFGEEVELDV